MLKYFLNCPVQPCVQIWIHRPAVITLLAVNAGLQAMLWHAKDKERTKDRKFNRMCRIIRVGTCPTDPVGTAPSLRFDTPSPVVLSEMRL
jgi:hypothetical protein